MALCQAVTVPASEFLDNLMAYTFVNSFKQGIDSRRSKISSQQGSLIYGRNVHINRGGEIEKRKAFVAMAEMPDGTHGLHATKFGIYVFGSNHPAVMPMPTGYIYQQLVAPGRDVLVEVASVDSYNSVPYVVAKFASGSVFHFYNGIRVTDWDTLSPGISNLATLSEGLANLVTTDPDVSASYALVSSVHTITITASAVNQAIPIVATVQNVSGVLFNSAVVSITQAATVSLPQIAKIEISSMVSTTSATSEETEAADIWRIGIAGRSYRLSGVASGVGSAARTFRGKVYATVQGLLYFSQVNDPTRWTMTYTQNGKKVDTFAGYESLSAQTGGSENLVTLAPYQNYLAIFARQSTQIWQVVPGDPVDNQPQQILDNVGTYAPRSAISFGELDVFFLSDSGVRSLRARDSSNAATVFDVGTSIDPVVVAQAALVGEATAARACGVIEPRDGRYMLAIGGTVFVYSFYPASRISAWTTYEPGFEISDFAAHGSSLYCRSGNTIYAYGGESGQSYDSTLAEVELSWLDSEKPAHKKKYKGLDLSCDGTWQCDYSTNPGASEYAKAGSLIGQNFSLPHFALSSNGTHVGLKFSTSDASPATISSVCVHFDFIDPPR